jgi:iron only hydrogenase large subunit-like protein
MKALSTNKLVQNFFEGMVCQGGCLNGPLGLRHNSQILGDVDKFGKAAIHKDPNDSAKAFVNNFKK